MYEMTAQHPATMWHWSPASVRWPWLHGEAWKLSTPILMLQRQLMPLRPLIAHAVKKSHYYLCPWLPIPPLKSWVALTFCLKQCEPVRLFVHKWFTLARPNNLYSLELRHIQHSRCNTLSTVWTRKIKNTGTNSCGEYIYSVGPIIGKKRGVWKSFQRRLYYIAARRQMWVSHCVNETQWYKTHPGQAWSVHKLECALRRFSSTDKLILQTIQIRNWWKDRMLSDMNLHESSHGISACFATCTWHSKVSPGKRKKHHVNSWGHSQENCKETTKAQPVLFIWRIKHLCARNLTTMEEFDWHDILTTEERTRQGNYSQVWPERLSNLMVPTYTLSTPFTCSKAQSGKE